MQIHMISRQEIDIMRKLLHEGDATMNSQETLHELLDHIINALEHLGGCQNVPLYIEKVK